MKVRVHILLLKGLNFGFGWFLMLCFLLFQFVVEAQSVADSVAYVVRLDGQSIEFVEDYWLKNKMDIGRFGLIELESKLIGLLEALRREGYVEASIDSVALVADSALVNLHVGHQYGWESMDVSGVSDDWLKVLGFREKNWSDKEFDVERLRSFELKLVDYAENNGYPFASVQLKDIRFVDGGVSGRLVLDSGPLILFDEVLLNEGAPISANYMSRYLGIKAGEAYSRKKLLKISNRVNELSFLRETKTSVVSFKSKIANVNLFLDKRRASRFDFLLGLQPGERVDDSGVVQQKLILSGDINAELYNQFGKGEHFDFHFERLRPSVQKLNVGVEYPYIFGLPFGAEGRFEQYRLDSTFNNLTFELGALFLLEGGNYFKAFYSEGITNVQIIDTLRVIQTKALPDVVDLNTRGIGLETGWNNLDYRYNPTSGWSIKASALARIKQVNTNEQILSLRDPNDEDFEFSSLYDSDETFDFQYQLKGNIARYFGLGTVSTVKAGLDVGYVGTRDRPFENEQFRIGGNQLLRGFDEESILATLYSVVTVEYRLLLGKNSFIYTFFDYGYVHSLSQDFDFFDRPFGLGGGISFETKAGLFSVGLAVGKQFDNPIDWQNPKVHLGYISIF